MGEYIKAYKIMKRTQDKRGLEEVAQHILSIEKKYNVVLSCSYLDDYIYAYDSNDLLVAMSHSLQQIEEILERNSRR